jgi:ClpP class serine protease
MEDVTRLADGSIFSAQEALAENMIDELGYFEDVVTKAMELAHLDKAQVVEYTRPFSLANFFGAKTEGIFKLDKSTIYELSTPDVMYLWSVH